MRGVTYAWTAVVWNFQTIPNTRGSTDYPRIAWMRCRGNRAKRCVNWCHYCVKPDGWNSIYRCLVGCVFPTVLLSCNNCLFRNPGKDELILSYLVISEHSSILPSVNQSVPKKDLAIFQFSFQQYKEISKDKITIWIWIAASMIHRINLVLTRN